LREAGIGQLIIVGVATHNSVESTARAAGNLGFDAWVVEDACFTFDKADYFGTLRTAEEVHGMSAGNLQGGDGAVRRMAGPPYAGLGPFRFGSLGAWRVAGRAGVPAATHFTVRALVQPAWVWRTPSGCRQTLAFTPTRAPLMAAPLLRG